MSTHDDRAIISEEEINEISNDSGYLGSDAEGEIREIILALPASSLTESSNVDETIGKEVAIATNLIVTAAEEAEGKTNQTLSTGPYVLLEATAGMSGSKVISSTQLTNSFQGPPKCNICGRSFGSWRAVFGHLRLHKNRGYQGFLPPPKCHVADEGSGGMIAASSGGGGSGLGTGGLGIDLNVDPVEEEGGSGSGFTTKFDLNKSSEEEDKAD